MPPPGQRPSRSEREGLYVPVKGSRSLSDGLLGWGGASIPGGDLQAVSEAYTASWAGEGGVWR